ncbi:MAG: hypothetical protein HKN20_10310 [Gemmatimonadetes bacterium]|nr:hypothetical protein [Gemmatimonadota bacterium]
MSDDRVAQLGATLSEIHRLEDTTIVIVQSDSVTAPTFPTARFELADGELREPGGRSASHEEAAS